MSRERKTQWDQLVAKASRDERLLDLLQVLSSLAIEDIFLSRENLTQLVEEQGIDEETGVVIVEEFGSEDGGNSSE